MNDSADLYKMSWPIWSDKRYFTGKNSIHNVKKNLVPDKNIHLHTPYVKHFKQRIFVKCARRLSFTQPFFSLSITNLPYLAGRLSIANQQYSRVLNKFLQDAQTRAAACWLTDWLTGIPDVAYTPLSSYDTGSQQEMLIKFNRRVGGGYHNPYDSDPCFHTLPTSSHKQFLILSHERLILSPKAQSTTTEASFTSW